MSEQFHNPIETFGNFRWTWYLYYCITFCATTLVRKKRGEKPGMRRTYFRDLRSGPLPVTSRHFRLKGPTRADIAHFAVAHAPVA
jgi:hypothetical protein